ncbi:testicular haploid expressed gene protein-like isoform X2 [Mya arenaria]|uniref:testicular haploid expressed gene protein-like isoform X2 n=1 Tax=Mya arenaria TaxID=6604 RepID=UPI0022E73D27|nr:testicular haploid expressed gene protein-like isoform X2 [Mya arenaria]XP_052773763.1 testicular haploid expressed gene protein-like isoform X2 [Mya arenaria]
MQAKRSPRSLTAGFVAEYERIRDSGSRRPGYGRSRTTIVTNRERLLQLSQPKEPKVEWYTSVGPHVRWGTQEMIWPVKPEALRADSTERLETLALPKVNFLKGDNINRSQFFYSCGRSSVLWKVRDSAKRSTSTERLNILAEPKRAHNEFKEDRNFRKYTHAEKLTFPNIPQFKYSCGRQSPIWATKSMPSGGGDREYTSELAKHKRPHRDFKPEKPIQTTIPHAALKAEATERLLTLSTPKPRPDGPFREPDWEVPGSAKNATASSRCLELARPKPAVDGYLLPRDEQWGVTKAAKRASSTGRIDELSRPIVRATMDHVQFNPDAFLVKPLALKGAFPPRVEQLSRPIER